MLIVLSSSVYSMVKIRNRSEGTGALTPTDQVLMSRHLLEASLMGYSLFLALIIDRLHHYIRELRSLRKSMDAVMKQDRSGEEAKMENSEEIKARDKQIALLTEEIEHLKVESETKVKDAKAAESNAMALKKQSEGFLLEYDRLLEENQSLRSQMQSNDSKKFI